VSVEPLFLLNIHDSFPHLLSLCSICLKYWYFIFLMFLNLKMNEKIPFCMFLPVASSFFYNRIRELCISRKDAADVLCFGHWRLVHPASPGGAEVEITRLPFLFRTSILSSVTRGQYGAQKSFNFWLLKHDRSEQPWSSLTYTIIIVLKYENMSKETTVSAWVPTNIFFIQL
jgi:hypothetical protein